MAELASAATRTLVVDFNNIALRAVESIASAGCYRAVEDARRSVREWLGSVSISEITYADEDVAWKFDGWDAYEKRELEAAKERGEFIIVSEGKADPHILSEAKATDGLIVSNDRYRDEVSRHGHEWLLFEPHRLIAPTSANGTHWMWRWVTPQEQIKGFYGTLGLKGPPIDLDYLRRVERETGYDFERPERVEGEPVGIHHLARELGVKVTSVRHELRDLGSSDYLGVALSEPEIVSVRNRIRKKQTS